MRAIEYNTGYYMDGTPWSIPLTDVRLKHQWTRNGETLYMAFEANQTPYWVEVAELGDNKRSVLVTGSRLQHTTLSLNDYLRKIHSLKVVK
jgi:hypothetical protein